MNEFILASRSPRRKSLLRNLIDSFLIVNPDIREDLEKGESPESFVLRIAEQKAKAAGGMVQPSTGSNFVIIAADTIVVDGDRILGKPADDDQAARMLAALRGRRHTVTSGLAVYDLSRERMKTRMVSSEVAMREYTDKEISDYVASGDPLDKAGAYAIQNHDFDPAPGFRDCYANVMGLPICHLAVLFSKMGLKGKEDVAERCQDSIGYQCPVFTGILTEINGKG